MKDVPAYPHGAQPRLTIVLPLALAVALALIALALLGMRFADAQRLVDAQAEQRQHQDHSQTRAGAVARAVDAQARQRADAALAAWRDGGAQHLRTHYLADPAIDMVALFDAQGNRRFPETADANLFAENRQLRRSETRLDDLRRAVRGDALSWSGSLSEPGSPAIACHKAGDVTICLLLRLDPLRQIAMAAARPAELVDLRAMPVAAPGMAQAVTPLAAPYAGLAVLETYHPQPGRSLAMVALLLAPTVLAALLAAAFAVRAHRVQIAAAEQHIDLLSGFSHDLRTPLANLRLYASLLRKPDLTPQRLARYADTIAAEAAQLSRRVDQILTTATQAAAPPGHVPDLRRVSPDDLVRDLLDRYRPAFANASPPTLDLQSPAPALFDAGALERVLLNLLDNARKHAPGSRPRVATAMQDGHVRLTVSDDGGAPDRRDVAGLGQGFGQGFGLGLRSCRAMARRAGGRFRADISRCGSRFHLELPVSPALKGDKHASVDRRG